MVATASTEHSYWLAPQRTQRKRLHLNGNRTYHTYRTKLDNGKNKIKPLSSHCWAVTVHAGSPVDDEAGSTAGRICGKVRFESWVKKNVSNGWWEWWWWERWVYLGGMRRVWRRMIRMRLTEWSRKFIVRLLPMLTMSVGVGKLFIVRVFVCLFVCPEHNSEMNDPKVFKLGTGNHLGIP